MTVPYLEHLVSMGRKDGIDSSAFFLSNCLALFIYSTAKETRIFTLSFYFIKSNDILLFTK